MVCGGLVLLAASAQANSHGGRATAARITLEEHALVLASAALAHEHGEGLPKDLAQAAALYCEAARLGNVEAAYALGWMYFNGRGLERHDGFAATLFSMAAAKGDRHAERMLRYTGKATGDRPACLDEPAAQFADAEWNHGHRLRGLPAHKRAVAALVLELAPHYEISPAFALAIAVTESALDPLAVSPKNAQGVMQLIPETAERFNVRNVFDPRENIKGGLAYLRWLLAYFEGDIALAAAAYNAGEGAVDRYRGVPPFRETQAYVKRVLNLVKRSRHPFDPSVVQPSAALAAMKLVATDKGRP